MLRNNNGAHYRDFSGDFDRSIHGARSTTFVYTFVYMYSVYTACTQPCKRFTFDKIFDLTAEEYFYFYNILPGNVVLQTGATTKEVLYGHTFFG